MRVSPAAAQLRPGADLDVTAVGLIAWELGEDHQLYSFFVDSVGCNGLTVRRA